ncbi:hypothetical protein H0H87_011491 [Tephrocybe sp. NHM501043]|nr:hypothetical protein H0H87_011491 [Tephrocybe sp. NHM501043]
MFLRWKVDTLTQYELVKCLLHILKSKVSTNFHGAPVVQSGAFDALRHDQIVSNIASALNYDYITTLKRLTDILVVFTHLNSTEGLTNVLKALEDLNLATLETDDSGDEMRPYDYWLGAVHSVLVNRHAKAVNFTQSSSLWGDDYLLQYAVSHSMQCFVANLHVRSNSSPTSTLF